MEDPSAWRPWPGGGARPAAALLAQVAGTALELPLAGLVLRHQLWTTLQPLPDARALTERGLPVPAELLAAGADNLPDRARVRRWLQSPTGAAAERAARALLVEAADCVDPELQPILAGIQAGHAHLDGVQAFGALLASTVPAPPDRFDEDAAAGAAWLLEAGRIEAVAEVQRWPPGHDGVLREHRWLAAHIRLLLHLGGLDQSGPLLRLFEALPAAPLRWYEGWPGIPPDSDSLGTWLRVAAAVGRADDPRIASWCGPLHDPAAPTLPGTWLATSTEQPAWGGDRCGGVQAALVLGLEAARPPGWRALAGRLLDDNAPSWHYPEPVAAAWQAEARRALGREAPSPPLVVGADADPLAIAAAVPSCVAEGDRSIVRTALRALARLQRPDGSWPACPYFLIPGKPPRRADRFLSPEVTTATCVRAMMLGARFLEAS